MECFIRKRGDWMIQDGEVFNQKKQHNHTLCGFFMECFIRKRGDWINCVDPEWGGTQPKKNTTTLCVVFLWNASSESGVTGLTALIQGGRYSIKKLFKTSLCEVFIWGSSLQKQAFSRNLPK
jgi:hypothetical protein